MKVDDSCYFEATTIEVGYDRVTCNYYLKERKVINILRGKINYNVEIIVLLKNLETNCFIFQTEV